MSDRALAADQRDPSAPASDQAVAYPLADRARRSSRRGAIPPSADMFDAIARGIENLDPVSDPSAAMESGRDRP